MKHVLALILGGGRGTRLFPLTHLRSKPAVPIAGKYRLIDVPISNCLHADIRRIYVLTQFNSASLNRHIAETYRMDMFSRGFVEILAAEQTPDNPNWFQGTADAVRQAARHFIYHDAEYYLILAGDHLYRMDYSAMIEEHIERRADITIAAQPVTPQDAPAMGIFRFDAGGQIVGFEEKPNAERLSAIGSSIPSGSRFLKPSDDKPFVASMGIYVFTRDVLLESLERHAGVDFGHEIIPAALGRATGQRLPVPRLLAGRRERSSRSTTRTSCSPSRGAPFNFYDPRRPVFTRPRFLPGSRLNDCAVDQAVIAEGCYVDRSSDLAVDRRDPHPDRQRLPDQPLGPARRRLLRERRRRPDARTAAARRWASAPTRCSTASSWTRTRGSAAASG